MNWKDFKELIVDSLSDDLLSKPFRNIKLAHPHANQAFGHCYVASEVAYYLLGGKEEGWTPQFMKVAGYPHWFLKHKSGFVFDPTEDQFKITVDHSLGRGIGFLTKEPSKRAKKLILAIRQSYAWEIMKLKGLDSAVPRITLERDDGSLDHAY